MIQREICTNRADEVHAAAYELAMSCNGRLSREPNNSLLVEWYDSKSELAQKVFDPKISFLNSVIESAIV